MTVVLLALGAALSYGLSDFLGGIFGRRATPWGVASVAGTVGAVAVSLVALADDRTPSGPDLAWAAVAGVGNGFGTAFLYRGLASGRMGVVAPVSGVTAAVLPVLVGVLSGERPAALVWIGVALAMPAIWLVAREPGEAPATTSGIVDGILAGLGFGALFATLAQVPASAGLWPLALNQIVGVAGVALIATVLGESWFPRSRAAWGGAFSGVLAGAATLGFLLATQHGLLTISAVLTSLYPAGTVVLAALLLGEHIHRTQLVGLGLCGVAVVCVAMG